MTIFQKLAKRDRAAVKDCIDAYGNLIWTLARKFTASMEEAEEATQEIFIDIWRYTERTDKVQLAEEKLIVLIALRRLMKSHPVKHTESRTNIANNLCHHYEDSAL